MKDKTYTRGEKIVLGRDANGFFKVALADKLPTKYEYKNSKKVYPECATVIFDYLKQFLK